VAEALLGALDGGRFDLGDLDRGRGRLRPPQPDGTFRLSSEGQVGDMQMIRGNRAIRDHEADGKKLHLFEMVRKGEVQYLGEVLSS